MDTNTNILSQNINIESYLNLGQNYAHHQLPSLDELDSLRFEPGFSCFMESQILLCKDAPSYHRGPSTLASEIDNLSQKKSAKEATAKYRERRKIYQKELEINVKNLQEEIQKADQEIKKVKDAVLQKLESSVKAVNSTENAQIYHELDSCLPKQGEYEELADIDKINLLLNTLKYRIGPSGRQRHAKIEYNFKNIINTLFPGLHRYFLISANKKTDIFAKEEGKQLEWTSQLIKKMNFSDQQLQKIYQYEAKLKNTHSVTMKKIEQLQTIKRKMKDESLLVDGAEDDLRESLSPVLCGKLIMFCEKYKYRKDIALDEKFRPKKCGNMIEDEMEELLQYQLGRKRVHRDPQSLQNCKS